MSERSAIETLLTGLFDYAGMFPPASLSFDECLDMAIAHPRELKRPHMIGSDMVLSIEHLPRITSRVLEHAGFEHGRCFKVALLGAALSEQSATEGNLGKELATLRSCSTSQVGITSYEVKVSEVLQRAPSRLERLCVEIQGGLKDLPCIIFLEPDLGGARWEEALDYVCSIAAMLSEGEGGARIGVKLRCSGPQAVTLQKLSSAIAIIAAKAVHSKATAGLHHPIIERDRYQNEFGFLNLSVALLLKSAFGDDFSEADTMRCLSCSEISDFEFNGALKFKQHAISRSEIQAIRQSLHFSIGSCSLLEPDRDLLRLIG